MPDGSSATERDVRATSAFPLIATTSRTHRHVAKVPIVLKKSFLTDGRIFLGPLVRCSCGDVRDHIVSHKNDHRPPYRSYRALQRRRPLKIDIREIFGIARFFDFCNSICHEQTSADA